MRTDGDTDADWKQVYIASLYWAVVTCCTVGYGDILPTNGYEYSWAIMIIVVGVAIFSYVLGDLSS